MTRSMDGAATLSGPGEPPQGAANAGPQDPRKGRTLTRSKVANRLDVSLSTVKRWEREGRLCPVVNGDGVHLFDADEVDALRAELREDGEGRERSELAMRANAVADLVSSAQGHSEQYAALLLKFASTSQADARAVLAAAQAENERLRARIEKLEEREDEIHASILALQQKKFDDMVADFNAEERKMKVAAAIKTATPFVGAAIARLIGGEQAQQGAFMQLVDSLSEHQQTALFEAAGSILTQSQAGALMLLFSQWQAKASNEQPEERSAT